jgi:hypothetical protein
MKIATIAAIPYLVIGVLTTYLPQKDIFIKHDHASSGDVFYYITPNEKIIAKRVPLSRPGFGGVTIDTLAQSSKEYQEIVKTPEYKLKSGMRKNYFKER